jgi:hypothetical protein
MAAWRDVEEAEAEFAARVRRLFDLGRHKTIATLRAGGSPRISGIDLFVADISEVVITRLNPEATLLVIESWTPQRGLRVVERE